MVLLTWPERHPRMTLVPTSLQYIRTSEENRRCSGRWFACAFGLQRMAWVPKPVHFTMGLTNTVLLIWFERQPRWAWVPTSWHITRNSKENRRCSGRWITCASGLLHERVDYIHTTSISRFTKHSYSYSYGAITTSLLPASRFYSRLI